MKDGLPSTEALLAAASALPRLPRLEDDPGGPVMVGVSGGADSVYLLLALAGDPALAPRLTVARVVRRVRASTSA
ncbi:MAG: hypothetical protein ACKOIB_05035, partial [Verrucomicrobiota bacterium]